MSAAAAAAVPVGARAVPGRCTLTCRAEAVQKLEQEQQRGKIAMG